MSEYKHARAEIKRAPTDGSGEFTALVSTFSSVPDSDNDLIDPKAYDRKVFATSSTYAGQPTGAFDAGGEIVFSVGFENLLVPGRYYISPHVALLEGPQAGIVDRRDRAAAFVVTGRDVEEGSLVNLPHDFTLERAPAARVVA